jgi:hypothetical protein
VLIKKRSDEKDRARFKEKKLIVFTNLKLTYKYMTNIKSNMTK